MMRFVKRVGLLLLYHFLYLLSGSLTSSVGDLPGLLPLVQHLLALTGLALLALVFYFFRTSYRREEIEVGEVAPWMRQVWIPVVLFILFWLLQILFPVGSSNNQNTAIAFVLSYPVYAFLQIVIFAPILEEYIFRGFIAHLFFPKMKGSTAYFSFMAVSGVLFSLVHFPNSLIFFLIYWTMGFLLAWVYACKLDLRYAIGLHLINNLLSFVLIFLSQA